MVGLKKQGDAQTILLDSEHGLNPVSTENLKAFRDVAGVEGVKKVMGHHVREKRIRLIITGPLQEQFGLKQHAGCLAVRYGKAGGTAHVGNALQGGLLGGSGRCGRWS